MIWFLIGVAIVGYLFYRLDKKFKTKFNDDTAPKDWDLPDVSESTSVAVKLTTAITLPAIITYTKNSTLFSPAEQSFARALNNALADDFTIFAKVRVADVVSVEPINDRSAWQIAFNKISNKNFDFILCDKGDSSILCAIDLHDKSRQQNDRIEREQLLEQVCQNAELPLIRFEAKETYSLPVVRAKVLHALAIIEKAPLQNNEAVLDIKQIKKTSDDATDTGEFLTVKVCPNCDSIMIKRKAKSGAQAGKLFWACSTYPNCRGVLPID